MDITYIPMARGFVYLAAVVDWFTRRVLEERGAWYCAFEAETSLGEVSYHLTRELEAIGRFENITDYAELIADFLGLFRDLRSVDRSTQLALHDDPAVAYVMGQTFAKRLRNVAASNGIVYPSACHAGDTCLVAFRPDLIQNLRQGGIWRLEWRGAPTPSATRQT
jgi:hypothetical protein